MRRQAALVRMTGIDVSFTRRFTYSQAASPSAVGQQSGPRQSKRWRLAPSTPALVRPAASLGFGWSMRFEEEASPSGDRKVSLYSGPRGRLESRSEIVTFSFLDRSRRLL